MTSTTGKDTRATTAVRLPPNVSRSGGDTGFAVVVEDVLNKTECDGLIEVAGPALAYVKATKEGVAIQSPRQYRLAVVEDARITALVWKGLGGALEVYRRRTGRVATGLNGRFRVLSYGYGESFDPHFDLKVQTSSDEETLLTVLVYLTSDFTGGETFFLDAHDPVNGQKTRIEPTIGRCLLFEHDLYHVGAPVKSAGQRGKFVLRSDVAFFALSTMAVAVAPPCKNKVRRIRDFLCGGTNDDHSSLREALDDLGLLDVSVDDDQPGPVAVREMLREFPHIPQPDLDRFIDLAFSDIKQHSGTPAYLRANIPSHALDLDSWRPPPPT